MPRDDPSAIEEIMKWAASTPSGARARTIDENGVELEIWCTHTSNWASVVEW